MARTPSMTAREAESVLGPRGNLKINADNRGMVRKWLTAQGCDSAFVATLRFTDLEAAYNDTSDATLARLQLECGDRTSVAIAMPDQSGKANDLGAAAAKPADAAELLAQLGQFISAKSDGIDADQVRDMIEAELDRRKIARVEVKRRDGSLMNLDGHYHPMFPTLCKLMAAFGRDGSVPPIFIRGEASSGKSYAARQVAKAMGTKFYEHGPCAMPYELLGFVDGAGAYHRTAFRDAYEHGGVCCLDELDRYTVEATLALNSAIASPGFRFPDGAYVEKHPDFILIGTANTWGFGADANYVGATKLDAAFVSRFPFRLTWNIDEEFERTIVDNPAWCARVQSARAKAKAAGLKVLIDMRANLAGAAFIAAGNTEQEAAEFTYLANLTADQRRMIEG